MPGFNRDSTGATDQNVMYADNVDFTGSTAPSPQMVTNGQLIIANSAAKKPLIGNLTSPDGSITIGYSSPNITLIAGAGPSPYISLTPYIVGQPGDTHAGYTTIQSAINAAQAAGASRTNPANVYIKPGTYAENLTLYSGVNLIAFGEIIPSYLVDVFGGFNTFIPSVKVSGTLSIDTNSTAAATQCLVQGIYFTTAAANLITIKGHSDGCSIEFSYCNFSNTQVGGVVFLLGNGYAILKSCFVDDASNSSILLNQIALFESYKFVAIDSVIFCSSSDTYKSVVGAQAYISLYNCFSRAMFSVTAGWVLTYAQVGGQHFNANNTVPFFQLDATSTGTIYYRNVSINSHFATLANDVKGYSVTVVNCVMNGSGSASVLAVPYIVRSANGGSFYAAGNVIERQGGGTSPLIENFIPNQGAGGDWTGAEALSGQNAVQTTDATVTTLAAIPIAQAQTITLSGTLTAAQSDHSNALGGNFTITARRASAGNVTLIGAAVVNVNTSSAATFTCDVDTGTQTIRVRVTGVAATTYNWICNFTYQIMNAQN